MARILVTSIPAWSKNTGYDSFSTLFEGNTEHEVANIYTRADLPDSDVCSRSFSILDGRVVKSVFKRTFETGSCVDVHSLSDDNATLKSAKTRYAYVSNLRTQLFLRARDFAW